MNRLRKKFVLIKIKKTFCKYFFREAFSGLKPWTETQDLCRPVQRPRGSYRPVQRPFIPPLFIEFSYNYKRKNNFLINETGFRSIRMAQYSPKLEYEHPNKVRRRQSQKLQPGATSKTTPIGLTATTPSLLVRKTYANFNRAYS